MGKKNKKKKQKNVFRSFGKIFIVITVIGVLAWGGLFAMNLAIDKSKAADGDLDSDSGFIANTPKKEVINFLLAGESEILTDTIMFCRYNTVTNELYMMSIPRDTYVVNPYCIGNKINAIYRGKNTEPFVSQIEDILDVKIDYYLIFNTKMVRELVDAIGGVNIYVPQRMYYTDKRQGLYINLQKGQQTLNGTQAEGFVRYRSGYANADLGRVEAQRDFVKAFLKDLMKPKNITNIPNLVNIVFKNTKTNVSVREALKYSDEIGEINVDKIVSITAPNSPQYINKISYVVVNKTEARKILKEDWVVKDTETTTGE